VSEGCRHTLGSLLYAIFSSPFFRGVPLFCGCYGAALWLAARWRGGNHCWSAADAAAYWAAGATSGRPSLQHQHLAVAGVYLRDVMRAGRSKSLCCRMDGDVTTYIKDVGR